MPEPTPPADLPDYAAINRAYWDGMAHEWVESGERNWDRTAPEWGIFGVPETELRLLPDDMTGVDAIELGCGTGYVSAWMARRGAAVTGIDNSAEQLATARRLAERHGVPLTLIYGVAEQVPLPDASFDFAISEYGAALWADPHAWIPEAYRLLRPGGRLVFLTSSALALACAPWDGSVMGTELIRPWFEIGRTDWFDVEIDPGGVEFHLTPGNWIRLFRDTGFEIEDFIEVRAPAGDEDEARFFAPRGWARRWPAEEVWKVRKRT